MLELLDSHQALVIGIAILVVYLPALLRSLWVDEAGTYWMACYGHLAAVQRTSHWPGQSILYALITSFSCFDGSHFRDLLLRVPSLLGAAAACYFLYRLADDAFGAGAGRIAAVLFAFSPTTVDFATQARPYALAMAASAASCWTLYRWTASRNRFWLASYVISSPLVLYFHYMFCLIFVAHAACLVYEVILKRRFARCWELSAGYFTIAILVIPIAPQILLLLHESHTLPYGPKPSGWALAEILIPLRFTASVFAAALLVHFGWPKVNCAFSRLSFVTSLSGGVAAMLLTWWCAGPLLLFAVSSTTSMQVFVTRYLSYSGLALVLLFAGAAYSLFGARAGLVWALLMTVFAAVTTLRQAPPFQPGKAEVGPFMRVIRDESANRGSDLPPVLFQSALVESNAYDWSSGNSPASYLYAAFAAYPMKNTLLPLPFQLTPQVEEHLRRIMETDLKNRSKVLLVTHDFAWLRPFAARFEKAGFTSRWTQPNDYCVMVFERPQQVSAGK